LNFRSGWVSASPLRGLQFGKRPFCLWRGRAESSPTAFEQRTDESGHHAPAARSKWPLAFNLSSRRRKGGAPWRPMNAESTTNFLAREQLIARQLQLRTVGKQRYQTEPKDQSASVNGVGAVWSAVMQETMCESVTKARPRPAQKYVFNVGHNSLSENSFQLSPHLFK
jgi:hypothetical protein